MISLIILFCFSFLEDNASYTIAIPRLGTFEMPVEACTNQLYPRAEYLFAKPWCRLGNDWTLRPGIARAWSVRDGHCIAVLTANAARYMSETGGFSDTSVTALSPHLVSISLESGWSNILNTPVERIENNMVLGFGDYTIQQWVEEQHVILTRKSSGQIGPDNIIVTACSSRERMIRGFLSGEFDMIDDVSFKERALLCADEGHHECFARRSNSMLYLMWNSTCLDVHDPAVRSVLSGRIDRRRLASRVGSRPSWVTACPLPPEVPGSWDTLPAEIDTSGMDIHMPESITILTEPRWEAVQAGKEVKNDLSYLDIEVRLVTSDQWIADPTYMNEPAAIVGVWDVSPNVLLPPSPRGWDDPISMSRTACEISTFPDVDTWISLSSRLESTMVEEMSLVCFCWLARWAAVNTSWIISDPGPGHLDGQIDRWRFRNIRK